MAESERERKLREFESENRRLIKSLTADPITATPEEEAEAEAGAKRIMANLRRKFPNLRGRQLN